MLFKLPPNQNHKKQTVMPKCMRPKPNTMRPKHTTIILLITLLTLTHNIHQTTAFIPLSIFQLRTLLSLSHSLLSRVATLRLSRGDNAGAHRAQLLASKLYAVTEFRFWRTVLSMCWEFVRNYAWHDTVSLKDVVAVATEVSEVISGLVAELVTLRDDSLGLDAWVAKNSKVFKDLFTRLLTVFTKYGPSKEVVEALQKEMTGDLLKDCLEVGGNDLRGVLNILKDLVASLYKTVDHKPEL